MSQRLRVFYAQTPSNQKLFRKLVDADRLHSMDFVPLDETSSTRKIRLAQIEGSCAFVWGDGYAHNESYQFTLQDRLKLKINVDGHADMSPVQDSLHYANHMWHSQQRGLEVITQVNSSLALALARERGFNFGKEEVAVTVDCDAFYAFPSVGKWVSPNPFSVEDALGLIKVLGERVFRFDIGGVLAKIPDFDLVLPGKSPGFKTTQQVVSALEQNRPVDPDLVNQVFSYAAEVYAKLLEAYRDHCKLFP